MLVPAEDQPLPFPFEDGTILDAVDVMGFDSTLTHCVKDDDPESQDSLIVSSWRSWFDSTWGLLAT
ncbi:hypothetical protein [Streptomyces griseorubiginosus]|uniref:hypothetical protein n=1 Tax=Streptomyces griseorubiginosus TaxID=67304 RepID=UPI002E7FFF45|nr:hypothetical protein [Streptomyces griseorubiginosus]WUB46073.1 hypothetical protein OHN19_23145 [Streptomyces griseorubiginosus]WUB54594.1 hypothetical protein OG942_23145 [Streptomyces griseorubiginosus]